MGKERGLASLVWFILIVLHILCILNLLSSTYLRLK
ncbi:MAG: hypothetical protein ACJAZ9_001787, partial [Neolewinella sp.]